MFKTKILLLGAGELGSAFLPHLSTLPNTHLTLGIRTPSKYTTLAPSNVTLIPLDTSHSSQVLAETFAAYDIVISATGMTQPAGSVTKLAKEILQAGNQRKDAGQGKLWFFPWQWGVNYDVTGDAEGMMPLFGEQKDVRDLLRKEAAGSNVKWTVVSTGLFMSFLFQQWWGVVDRQGDSIMVRAMGEWDHKVSVTDVADIGKVLARVVAGEVEAEDRIVYAAGDTISYAQLADIVERTTGKKVEREEWKLSYLQSELAKDPGNQIKKYRLVFVSAREGVSWDKELTVNHKLGIQVTDVESYVKKLFEV